MIHEQRILKKTIEVSNIIFSMKQKYLNDNFLD